MPDDPELMPYYGPTDATQGEARGFIAPFVDEFGQTHSTAYDSRRADMEAQTLAHRYKGQQLYQSLVSGGASPAEAYRLAAPDLLFNDIKGQLKAAPNMNQQPFTPRVLDVDGVKMAQVGRNSAQVLKTTMPQELADQRKMILSKISTAQRRLANPEGIIMAGETPESVRNDLASWEQQYMALGKTAATTPELPPQMQTTVREGTAANRGRGGIEMRREAVTPTASPAKEGTVTTKAQFDALPSGAVYTGKDGRKYRKP